MQSNNTLNRVSETVSALPHILVVEHDPAASCVLEMAIRQRVACTMRAMRYAYELIEALEKDEKVALIVADVSLPDMSGLELISTLSRKFRHVPVIVAAGVRDDALVKPALEQGAVEYVRKTDSPVHIATVVKTVLAKSTGGAADRRSSSDAQAASVEREQHVLSPMPSSYDGFADIVGTSSAIAGAIEQARRAATSDIPVILKGESGVGKERFAHAIHASSARLSGPFVAVNCGAIPANLVESTLFGHVKGAFTGATGAAAGKFREADGGTLFLDEVGELPMDVQVKLLRALQEREVQPVGGGKPVPVDIRIISATHVDLEQALAMGRMREDLYYRLHVFPIEIPPLRARGRADIEALVKHFVKRFAHSEGKTISKVSDAAMGLVCSYGWPGNIRQLENAVYRAVVMAKSELLMVEDFVLVSTALQQRQLDTLKHQAAPVSAVMPHEGKSDGKYQVSILGADNEFRTLDDIEHEVLRKAVQYYRWHVTNMAKALGVTRATIYKKMKAAGIEDPRESVSG